MTPTPFSALNVPRRPLHQAYRPDSPAPIKVKVGRGGAGRPEGPSPESRYLRRWLAHQAHLYNDLLQTIAGIPAAR